MVNQNWLMNAGWLYSLVILLFFHFLISVVTVMGQNNPQPNTRDANAIVNFYLTSKTYCRDDLKNIYGNEAVVEGIDPDGIGKGPTSCTIRLTSTSVYPGVQLEIFIISMDIKDCRTHLAIYDGGKDTQMLNSFDCRTGQVNSRQRLVTTGDTVSFVMDRPNADTHNFDIEIRVKRVDQNQNKIDYYSFQKFEQEAIIGMIAGFYGLIFIVCLCAVCYCNIKYRRLNKKWESHQLATMKSDAAFDTQSQVSQPPWSVGVPSERGANSQYARSVTETYSRKGMTARSEDGSSVYDERFPKRNLMSDERDRYRSRDRMATANSTYSDDEEDDPDNFKEKIITPRVRTKGNWKPKDRRPPSFEEATRSSSRERSSDEDDEETEESSDNDSTRKRLTTSSENSGSYTESESEESSDGSRRGARAKRNKKKPKRKEKPKRRQGSLTDDASSQRTEPRRKQPQPPPVQGGVPYGAYIPPGGQFVMAGPPPPQFQPVHMVPPNYPPPQYPVEPSHPPASQPNVKPTEPPVYSYLARRGYTPLDPHSGGDSQVSSVNSRQRTRPAQRDEHDLPLQSGVEYMRR